MRHLTRIALLVNPSSGVGAATDAADALRRHGARLEVFDSAATEAAVASNPDRVAVAGGDGTIAPAAAAAGQAGVPLAVLPVGTANDFARALELPDSLDAAARLAVTGTRRRALELGRMNDRPFVNAASAGLSPVAARRAQGLKALLGSAAYVVGALRAGATAAPVPCELHCEGRVVFAGEAWQVTVACTGAFGGGADVEADPADGLLDACVIERASRVRLVRHAWGLRLGSVEGQPGVRTATGRRLELVVPSGTAYNLDGELVRDGPATFTVTPRAFELVVG